MTPCANCKKFYCWDGQIFSEEAGYTPPPGYVLQYWEEVHRKSQQMREDIDRRGKELREQYEKSVENTARLNAERMQAHQQYMDDLHRHIEERRSASASTRGTMAAGTPSRGTMASAPHVIAKDVVVVDSAPSVTAPPIPPASRAKAQEVKVGMDRAAVESLLGKPHSAMSIPEDDRFIEILTYTLDDQGLGADQDRAGQSRFSSVVLTLRQRRLDAGRQLHFKRLEERCGGGVGSHQRYQVHQGLCAHHVLCARERFLRHFFLFENFAS